MAENTPPLAAPLDRPLDLSAKHVERLAALKHEMTEDELSAFSDRDLCRFLVARSWKVTAAEKMIRANIVWRQDNHIETLWKNPPAKAALMRQLCPTMRPKKLDDGTIDWSAGVDREGYPVYFEKTGLYVSSPLHKAFTPDEIAHCDVYFSEHRMRVCEHARADKFLYVVDFDGLRSSARKNLSHLTSSAPVFDANFPERVRKVVFVNVPWTFEMMFKFVRPFIPKATYAKFHFVSGDPSDALRQLIDPKFIPVEYGGDLDGDVFDEYTEDHVSEFIVDATQLTECTIAAGKKHQIRLLVVAEPTALVKWHFLVRAHDVRFSVDFEPHMPDGAVVSVVAPKKFGAGSVGMSGQWMADQDGEIVVTFDNSHSRWRSKHVSHLLEVCDVEK